MKKILIIFILVLSAQVLLGQTAPEITPNSLTLPRLTTVERDATKPVRGQIIFNTTTNELEYYNGSWKYFQSYQTVNIKSVESVTLYEGLTGKIDFTISKDSKLTATYSAYGSNISIENPSGSVPTNSSTLTLKFLANTVGTGNLTLYVADSQNRSINKNVKIIVNPITSLNKSYADSTLIVAYKSLLGFTDSWFTWDVSPSHWMLDLASDDFYKGSDPGDYSALNSIENFTWDANHQVFENNWNVGMEAIRRANNAIKIAKAYYSIDPNYSKQIEAEAKFLRAYYHFDLYKIFKNIPYYFEVDNLNNKQNLQGSEVLLNIIKDLDFAALNLQNVKSGRGRVDKMVATSFLGKAKVYIGDYSGALTAFNSVINSGRFSLNYDFHDNFKEDSDLGPESILQGTTVFGSPPYANFGYGDRLALPYGTAPSHCCGFKTLTYDLAYAFRTDANGLPIPIANAILQRIPAGSSTLLDPRIDWTMGRTNVPFLDWGLHKDDWIRYGAYAGWYSDKKGTLATLGGARKDEFLSNVNYNLFRYADLLLLAAECEVKIGSLEKARTYVNQIRERASHTAQGLSSVSVASNSSEINWAAYRIRQYTSSWTSQVAALDAVKLERRLELAMEGHRIFDLQRWGDLISVISAHINRERNLTIAASSIIVPTSKNLVFPIPQSAIDKSGGLLVQNPGY